MQMRQRIQGKEHTWGILLLKKNVHTSWAVSPLLLECMCFPFRNTTWNRVSSLLSFIQPQIEQERRLHPSDPTQVQSGMPLVCNGVCSCQFYRAPQAAASKAILQLSCWHETAFDSPHCQNPSAAHFSSLSLRKQTRLSPVRWRAPRFINNCGWGASRLSACKELHTARATAALGNAAQALWSPSLLCPERLGSLCCRPCCCTEQLLQAEPQPLLTGEAPWPLPGVASVTTALTTNCGTQLHGWGKRLDAWAPSA